jgi:hypothetical protein
MARVAIAVVLVAPLVAALFGAVVRLLWNWLMPALFGLPAVTFWQALGLLVLSWILFGGRRGFAAGSARWSPGGLGRRSRWRRWREMNPQQRAALRQALDRCWERPAGDAPGGTEES